MKIKFEKDHLKKLIYWIMCKFKADKFHQGLSGKRDLIGGFFDRWLNRAPEFLIFDKLLENKNYQVVLDNFLYGHDTNKNAPDVIGLEQNGNISAVFTEFYDDRWIQKSNMPFIEVKTFRNDQYLTAVNETQMNDDHYFVFVESNIKKNYLSTIFEDGVFNEEIYKSLAMSNRFVKSNKKENLILPQKLKKIPDLGFFKLIGIYKGREVKKYSYLAKGKRSGTPADKVRYISTIEEKNSVNGHGTFEIEEGIFKYDNGEDKKYAPIYIKYLSKNSKIIIKKKYKGNIKLKVVGRVRINSEMLEDGYYRINFKKMDRNSSKNEFIGHKDVFENYADDVEDELVNIFEGIVNNII